MSKRLEVVRLQKARVPDLVEIARRLRLSPQAVRRFLSAARSKGELSHTKSACAPSTSLPGQLRARELFQLPLRKPPEAPSRVENPRNSSLFLPSVVLKQCFVGRTRVLMALV